MKSFLIFIGCTLIVGNILSQSQQIHLSTFSEFKNSTVPFTGSSNEFLLDYFTIGYLKDQENKLQEFGLSTWGIKTIEVQNFETTETSLGLYYGYGWNIKTFNKNKIKWQFINYARPYYSRKAEVSKFFEDVINEKLALGITLQTSTRLIFNFSKKWTISTGLNISIFDFRNIRLSQLASGERYNTRRWNNGSYAPEVLGGLSVGYLIEQN